MEPRRFWGHGLDRFGSRDVIGHVTIGSADSEYLVPCTALQVGRRPVCEASPAFRSSNKQQRSTSASVEPLLLTASWMLSIQRLRGRPGGLVLFGRQ